MRERISDRLNMTPARYHQVAKWAFLALALIVLSGAAVRVTGSGLGCPTWPQCYKNGRLVAESNSHALIEFSNRAFSGLVAVLAVAAGVLAFFRRPYRRDLMLLGVALPLGVVAQAVLGGLTVRYGLAPGWVMSHFLLSMIVLVAAQQLFWRSRPAHPTPAGAPDRFTAWFIRGLAVLGAFVLVVGTAATAAGPHAGASGTGEIVPRFYFEGAGTLNWLIARHGFLAGLLGVGAVVAWFLNRRRGGGARLQRSLTILCLLMAAQGIVGITQYELKLPAEIVWIHVALATYTWISLLFAWSSAGLPARSPATAPAADDERTAVGAAS
jgi:cytochrome c oxidase assembly protein subunit 15